ncbi:MAG: putative ferrochelatase [Friedmanniella sp.]|nr:putative ferrochelatase [Friedmanniella sp.]
MTAPSFILLGYGSSDPRVAQVSQEIRTGLLAIRPELDIQVAFLDHCSPSGLQVAAKLARKGVTEAVFVPLLLSDAFHAHVEVPALIEQVQAAYPDLRVIASRPIGPEAQLLSVIDRRLRDALRSKRVSELDGLVFAAAGSSDVRSNAIVARRARQWATHHRLPCVTAFATGSGPTTAEAIRTLRAQGRRHIAVGSWFLAPGSFFTRQAELAYEAGAIAVSDPMGGEPEIAEVALTRYLVSAMDLVDLDTPAEVAEVVTEEDFTPVRHLSVVSDSLTA